MPFIKTHENLHKNVNENRFSFTFLCKFSHFCNLAIFVLIFIKFSPKYRTQKLGMRYTIIGSFCSFFKWGRGQYSAPNQAYENLWDQVLFRIISSSNYRKVDVKLYNPNYITHKNYYYQFFPYPIFVLGVKKKRLIEMFLLHTQN